MANTSYSRFPEKNIVKYDATHSIVNRGAVAARTSEARKLEDHQRLSPEIAQTTWTANQFSSQTPSEPDRPEQQLPHFVSDSVRPRGNEPTRLYPPDTSSLSRCQKLKLEMKIWATAPDFPTETTEANIFHREYQTLLSYMKLEKVEVPKNCRIEGMSKMVKFALCVNAFRRETGRLPPPSIQLTHLLKYKMLDRDPMAAWADVISAIAPERAQRDPALGDTNRDLEISAVSSKEKKEKISFYML